jgi:DME family drug/metabolite transporter
VAPVRRVVRAGCDAPFNRWFREAANDTRPSYDRGVHRARQAPRTVIGLVLIALAAISWGTSGSVMTVLAERAAASPLLVGVARLWIAAIFLLVATVVTARGVVVATGDRWRCLAMGACMAAYQAAYFTAVTLAGIAVVALVAICSAPLMIAALAPWLLGERLPPRVGGALLLGVLGTALLVAAPAATLDLSPRFLAGVLLAFVAGLAYALYVLAAKATLRRSAPLPATALTFTIGALLLTPALVWTAAPLTQLALGWPWLLYLGGVATAAAYAIYTLGLRSVPASVAGVTTLLEPLTATILGVALFGERLGAAGAVGALLLVTALGLLLADRGRSGS